MAYGEALTEWPVVRRMAVARVVVKKCIFSRGLFLEKLLNYNRLRIRFVRVNKLLS
jgi:hypothetical protein